MIFGDYVLEGILDRGIEWENGIEVGKKIFKNEKNSLFNWVIGFIVERLGFKR